MRLDKFSLPCGIEAFVLLLPDLDVKHIIMFICDGMVCTGHVGRLDSRPLGAFGALVCGTFIFPFNVHDLGGTIV